MVPRSLLADLTFLRETLVILSLGMVEMCVVIALQSTRSQEVERESENPSKK